MLKEFIGLIIIFLIFVIIVGIFAFIGETIGKSKANRKLNREIRKVRLSNPYIYYRDIPNDYGIGVYGFLLDYKLTKRDVKAALLDLSAKGYLKINTINKEMNIELTSKDNTNLLKNEKYLLNWLSNNSNINLNKFNISEWEESIRDDILELGIGLKRGEELDVSKNMKTAMRITISLLIVILIFGTILDYIKNPPIDITMTTWFFNRIVYLTIPIILFLPVFLFSLFITTIIANFRFGYHFKMDKSLKYTEKTKDVIQAIYSLGAFIKDFSNFAEKNVDEIIIWERYFSYAYLLGLNNKLDLKYTNIYKNKHFTIDSSIFEINEVNINKSEEINEDESQTEQSIETP